MKKLLALLLSVIMAASLAAPAFAAEPDKAPVDGDPGFWLENGLPVPTYTPGDVIPISAILDDESIGIIGGQDGPTAIITSGPSFPGPDTADWSSMEDHFKQLVQAQAQAQRDELKKSLGGVPGQVGVIVNGEYVKFPDAAPEMTKGRAMVPVRALMEALGGEADYQDGTIRIFIDKYGILLTEGSTEAMAYVRGTETGEDNNVVELDCAPYLKDGRAYVPIRFIGEALGYEVGWDNEYETVILLDREALAAEIDKDFTILNRVQGARAPALEEGKSLRQDLKGNANITLFDTLNGSKTCKVDLTGETLLDSEAASGTYSLILSDNMIDLLVERHGWLEEDELELMRTVLKGLKDMQVVMTDGGKLWGHAPAMDEVSGKKNAWCAVDMGAEFGKAMFSGANVTTMGEAIAAMTEVNSVMGWSQVMEAAKFLDNMYGDKCFTTSGGTSTRTIDLEELAKLAEVDADEAKKQLKEFKLVMEVDSKGGATATCTMETEAQSGMPAMKLTMDCTQSGGKADLTMTLHVANLGEGELTLTTTQQTTSEKPMSEPPAGANIVDVPADAPALLNP